MKRLFVGIPVESKTVEKSVKTWMEDPLLNLNLLNWVKSENWHITLFFLGNTQTSLIPLLIQLIEESFCSVQAFGTMVSGAGVFPHERNPKVLWLGMENLQLLLPACSKMGEDLQQNGFIAGYKPLKPHLTMARIKNLDNRSSFDSFLTQNRQMTFGSVAINRVVLYESVLDYKGPVYKSLFVKTLGYGQYETNPVDE